MLNIDLEEAHLTVEAEAVISSKERHCVTAGITKNGSLGRSTPTDRGEMRQALQPAPRLRIGACDALLGYRSWSAGDAQAGAFVSGARGYSRASFSGVSGFGPPFVGAIARALGGDVSNRYERRTRRGSRAQEEGHTRGAA